jgi:lipase chaperone LimK
LFSLPPPRSHFGCGHNPPPNRLLTMPPHLPLHRRSAAPAPSILMPANEAPTAPMTQEEEDYLGEKFNVDANGNLVVDVRARNTLEKLYALYTPEQQAQRLQELSQELSPAAYSRAADLLERWKEYSMAAKHNFPPGTPLANEDEALVQLESMSALRVAHFGADAAKGMFSAEEKLNRQLIGLMRLEKDESLTMEEKAQRAQKLISTSPDLAAIEKRNRESAPK